MRPAGSASIISTWGSDSSSDVRRSLIASIFATLFGAGACATAPEEDVYTLSGTIDTTVTTTCCQPSRVETTTVASPFNGSLHLKTIGPPVVGLLELPSGSWETRGIPPHTGWDFCQAGCGPYYALQPVITADSIYGKVTYNQTSGSVSIKKWGRFVARR